MESIDTLISARWILPVEPTAECLVDHALAIRGGRIVALLPTAAAHARYAAREIVDRPHHLLIPGLVNAHVQTATRLLRALPATQVNPDAAWLDPEIVRQGATLAMAEMLMGGITCFAERSTFPDIVASTAAELGHRVSVGLPIADRPSAWANGTDEYFERGLRLRDDYRDHPLVATALALDSLDDVGDVTLARLQKLVDQVEAPLSVRLPNSPTAIGQSLARHGLRPLARMERLGLLNRSLAALHLHPVTDDELRGFQQAGATAVVCVEAAMLSGCASIPDLLGAGIPLSLSAGSSWQSTSLDLLETQRLATALASHMPADSLRWATLNGARALGLEDAIGSLVPGKWADLCCLDLHHVALIPYDQPPVGAWRAASRGAVTDTWVAGHALYTEGQLNRPELAVVRARAQSLRARLVADTVPIGEQ